MKNFILLQLKLYITEKNTIPIEKLENFVGVYITQEEFDTYIEEHDKLVYPWRY